MQGLSAFGYSPGGVLDLTKLKVSMQYFYETIFVQILRHDRDGNFEIIKKQIIQINNLKLLNKR